MATESPSAGEELGAREESGTTGELGAGEEPDAGEESDTTGAASAVEAPGATGAPDVPDDSVVRVAFPAIAQYRLLHPYLNPAMTCPK